MSHRASKPLDRCYWVVPGKLLAGCLPGDLDAAVARARLTGLLDAGIRCVIALPEAEETGRGGLPGAYEPALSASAGARGVRVKVERHALVCAKSPCIDVPCVLSLMSIGNRQRLSARRV
jgi:hypothetical protein